MDGILTHVNALLPALGLFDYEAHDGFFEWRIRHELKVPEACCGTGQESRDQDRCLKRGGEARSVARWRGRRCLGGIIAADRRVRRDAIRDS